MREYVTFFFVDWIRDKILKSEKEDTDFVQVKKPQKINEFKNAAHLKRLFYPWVFSKFFPSNNKMCVAMSPAREDLNLTESRTPKPSNQLIFAP